MKTRNIVIIHLSIYLPQKSPPEAIRFCFRYEIGGSGRQIDAAGTIESALDPDLAALQPTTVAVTGLEMEGAITLN
jgi:hypothetical protein